MTNPIIQEAERIVAEGGWQSIETAPNGGLCFECGNPFSIHGDYVCLDKRDEASARRKK